MIWIVLIAAFLIPAAGLGPLRRALARRGVLDRPNARSSHSRPVPKGAGLLVVPAVAMGWLLTDAAPPAVIALGMALAALSWLDDLRDLPVAPRFVSQAVAVGFGVFLLPSDLHLLQGTAPVWLDRAVAFLAWLWFVNLFNFMDGIDGITGMACCAAGLGFAFLPWIAGPHAAGLVLAAAAAGFLVWNWPPARLFLGDVGSIGLGYLIGWLLIGLAASGQWIPALLLAGYHLADASLTLLLRLSRGERIWLPSKAHFYQRGAAALGGHRPAVLRIAALQLALASLAAAAGNWPQLAIPALLCGGLMVAALLCYFATVARKTPDAV